MKSLASLKRDLNIGDSITLIESPQRLDNSRLGVKRHVVRKQTNGVYLNKDKNASRGSFLELPNAKLVEYDGNEIRVYDAGVRPLTAQEQAAYDNRPSARPENQERIEYDLMAGTNIMFWRDKKYFKDMGMGYLHYENSNRYKFHSYNMTVTDNQLKGDLVLRYLIGGEL